MKLIRSAGSIRLRVLFHVPGVNFSRSVASTSARFRAHFNLLNFKNSHTWWPRQRSQIQHLLRQYTCVSQYRCTKDVRFEGKGWRVGFPLSRERADWDKSHFEHLAEFRICSPRVGKQHRRGRRCHFNYHVLPVAATEGCLYLFALFPELILTRDVYRVSVDTLCAQSRSLISTLNMYHSKMLSANSMAANRERKV